MINRAIKFFKRLFCRHNQVQYHGFRIRLVTFVKHMNEGPSEKMTKNFPMEVYSCTHCGKFLDWYQISDDQKQQAQELRRMKND